VLLPSLNASSDRRAVTADRADILAGVIKIVENYAQNRYFMKYKFLRSVKENLPSQTPK
jgi:hypothetical protein